MKYGIMIPLMIIITITFVFATGAKENINGAQKEKPVIDGRPGDNTNILEVLINDAYRDIHTIYLAGGCFWGVEGYFTRVQGVVDTQAGYANGETENPSYEDVINSSGHAETVKIMFDENVISLEEIILHFLRVIDPYSINRQGNDIGIQYRSGIYYTSDEQAEKILKVIGFFEKQEGQETAIETEPLQDFYDAEEYHQDYLEKNPFGYCHIPLKTADDPLFEFELTRDMSDEALKSRLDGISYNVTQKGGTEMPFTSEYLDIHEKGIYVDIASGEPLFSSADKYTSGSGWPSFTKAITANAIEYIVADSYSVVEVRSKFGSSHLGHVFTDGPKDEGGLHYCINGSALDFISYEELEEQGYGAYKVLFED